MSRKALQITTAICLAVTVGLLVGLFNDWLFTEPPAVLAPDTQSAEAITFLTVGRQGYGNDAAERVAAGMERVAAETPMHFVVFGGDNFYPDGVASVDDPQWQSKFEDLFDGPHLRGTPCFAVLGNHDRRGNQQAQVDYAKQRKGSGRWRMDGYWYARDFGRTADGSVLLRVVFLDMMGMLKSADEQNAFLREAMAAPGDPKWKAIVGHNPLRSLAERESATIRVMDELLPIAQELGVDLAISSNDWFQQLLNVPGEPMHVSTSGGGEKMEDVPLRNTPDTYTQSQHGFARVRVDTEQMVVEMMDADGNLSFTAARRRE